MPPIRRHLVAAVAAAVIAAPALSASAQTKVMSPPPGNLAASAPSGSQAGTPAPAEQGGRQPMSNAASNTVPENTHTDWAPSLPAPDVADNAPPAEFLHAAERAIATNRTGEAQEALERAESRALDRSVRPSKAGEPSAQPLVKQIADARQALGEGDRLKALSLIKAALANPDATAAD